MPALLKAGSEAMFFELLLFELLGGEEKTIIDKIVIMIALIGDIDDEDDR